MFEEFTTLTYLLSFPGMIAAVIMLTQFTKRMFDSLIPANRTKYIVYLYALAFSVLAAVTLGTWTSSQAGLESVVVWLINSVIVWLSAMKAFETVAK